VSDMDQNMHTPSAGVAKTLKWMNRLGFGLVILVWGAMIISPLWERVVG